MKRALIVGGAGQDGTLLAQWLTKKSIPHVVVNRREVRESSGKIFPAIDLGDAKAVEALIQTQLPSHVFYLAAHHHSSQENLEGEQAKLWQASFDVQVLGLVHFLEALRRHAPESRLFYASSSHVFGTPAQTPQTELTPLAPENIYAIAKVAGMQACRHYRHGAGPFASVGILYNHESIYRQEKFLYKKIIQGALAIRQGRQQQLVLGDLSAEADWGYAPDYVEAMVRILELPEAGDYIVATGQLHTVREFAEIVFAQLGLDVAKHVVEDSSLVRPRRGLLVGDSRALQSATGWKPSLSFEEMVRTLTRQLESIEAGNDFK
jgi:GDPmannose 4,6-dehydratase